MNFLVSGYFGFHNAGDEAVLAAMGQHLRAVDAKASLMAVTGDLAGTARLQGCRTVGRQKFTDLVKATRACDVFISGGGSLMQDVTSLRNVVYYSGLIRLAHLARKPCMVYAQGVGPLRRPLSRKLVKTAFSVADLITVRDPDSKRLLQDIGVKKEVHVTADPVWALQGDGTPTRDPQHWVVALRSWPNADLGALRRLVEVLRAGAENAGAKLRFLPMQPGPDHEILHGLASFEEVIDVAGEDPRHVLALAGSGCLMLAMRLHALIFAASLSVPVVAISYDPKVASLAKLISAPLIDRPDEPSLRRIPEFAASARPLDADLLQGLRERARQNARMAVELGRSGSAG